MRLWTLQAPEVVAAVRTSGRYRASWARVTPNWRTAFEAMTAEMARRGMDCADAPPVWCWPGRALRAAQVRTTANLLLGDHEWAHGRWLLKLDVPERCTLVTSYGAWNDYLAHTMGFADAPDQMDWSGTPTWKRDSRQVTIPELRREWLTRAVPYPPDQETAARIAADPDLRTHP
ncbi:DUF3841 domain-containing protein [Nocardia brasiliensis]|uniref:DUF3841 domain-containing protein n=1 Tax=Nocardia brasiliensis TaxID=37326 RepID=UPI001EEC2201|nr:DUF3841 domain-containing protein [Nocardia brasiliensis]